jgi:hypothetical protein
MAAPTKNLVDATSLTVMPSTDIILPILEYRENNNMFDTYQTLPQNDKFVIYYGMESASSPVSPDINRWDLVNVSVTTPVTLMVPMSMVGFNVKTAQPTVVITFPSIYKERTGTRLTEGQLFPTGKK